MRYYIYCDESSKKGSRFSRFYGGVLVDAAYYKEIKNELESMRSNLIGDSELKWTKVNEFHLPHYIKMMDLFFDLLENYPMKVRIMFMQNIFKPDTLSDYQRENGYFLLYYQFLKHAFGFRDINSNEPTHLELFFDKLPDTKEKNKAFKKYIYGIQFLPEFVNSNITIREDAISEVDSKKHIILQCGDVILGSMFFRLNNLHKEKNQETGRRGKRTIAKEKLYKHILMRIKKIYPKFNTGISTGKSDGSKTMWEQKYRHWNFKPNNK